MFKHALVTGGAGFIGSHLVRALLEEGLQVTVLDDLSMGTRDRVPPPAHLVVGDIRDTAIVGQVLDGVDILFHQAARVSIRASLEHFYDDAEINLMGTLNLLRGCATRHVRKIVMASSMAVYNDRSTPEPIQEDSTLEPISPYGVSKLASEKYCRLFAQSQGLDCQVLRYFNTYGPGQTFTPYVGVITIFCHQLLQGKAPTIFGDGLQMRDFVHVSDIVQANLLAMRSSRSSGTYNVGTGQPTSVLEVGQMLCQRIAPELELRFGPPQPGELRNSLADLSRISAELGYAPRVKLADRLDEVIAEVRNRVS